MSKERFSAKKVGRLLKEKLLEELDEHQYQGEFHEDCIQCQRCKMIREIAQDLHNATINEMVFGKPPSRRGRKRAYSFLGVDDTDHRVSARVRRG